MQTTPYLLIQVSASDEQQASTIARTVVERKIAACAQIFPIRSYYEWEDKLNEDHEYLILIKSRAEHFDLIEACVRELHTYQVPEILALPILAGSQPYLNWLDRVVGTTRKG